MFHFLKDHLGEFWWGYFILAFAVIAFIFYIKGRMDKSHEESVRNNPQAEIEKLERRISSKEKARDAALKAASRVNISDTDRHHQEGIANRYSAEISSLERKISKLSMM